MIMHDETALRNRLLERYTERRVNPDTGHVEEEVPVIRVIDHGQYVKDTEWVDRTVLFTPGDRYTGDVWLLWYEAELAEDELDKNYAYPMNDKTEQSAREKIDADGLTPAWEVAQ